MVGQFRQLVWSLGGIWDPGLVGSSRPVGLQVLQGQRVCRPLPEGNIENELSMPKEKSKQVDFGPKRTRIATFGSKVFTRDFPPMSRGFRSRRWVMSFLRRSVENIGPEPSGTLQYYMKVCLPFRLWGSCWKASAGPVLSAEAPGASLFEVPNNKVRFPVTLCTLSGGEGLPLRGSRGAAD